MNTRISVSVALAAGAALGLLFSHALPPAQAQTPPPSVMDARVARLENRVDSLEAEVNRLQANNITITSPGISPFYQSQPVLPAPRQSNIPPSQITLLGKSTP